jgi:hypothetical protein
VRVLIWYKSTSLFEKTWIYFLKGAHAWDIRRWVFFPQSKPLCMNYLKSWKLISVNFFKSSTTNIFRNFCFFIVKNQFQPIFSKVVGFMWKSMGKRRFLGWKRPITIDIGLVHCKMILKSLCSCHPHHPPIHTFLIHAAIEAPLPYYGLECMWTLTSIPHKWACICPFNVPLE